MGYHAPGMGNGRLRPPKAGRGTSRKGREKWEPDKRAALRHGAEYVLQHNGRSHDHRRAGLASGAQLVLAQFTRLVHSSSERRILHRTGPMDQKGRSSSSSSPSSSRQPHTCRVWEDMEFCNSDSSTAVTTELMLTRGDGPANCSSGADGDTGHQIDFISETGTKTTASERARREHNTGATTRVVGC